MIISIKKHIVTLFLVTSTLFALASDPSQDPSSSFVSGAVPSVEPSSVANGVMNMNLLMRSHIASLFSNNYHRWIVSSGTRGVEIYNESNRKRLGNLGISLPDNDRVQQEILITKEQLEKIHNLNVALFILSVNIDGDTIQASWLNNIRSIVITEGYQEDTDAFKGLNFLFKHNPKLYLVVNFPPNVTAIGDNFKVPDSLKRLELRGDGITSIKNQFLFCCYNLKTIDLSGLSNITSIGHNFLSCTGLTTLDLSTFSNLTSIGVQFLTGCSRLRTIDLSSLSNVTSIGHNFLSACTRLRTLHLSSLSNVTSIGHNFLSACTRLTTLDLPTLSNARSIGYNFISACTRLNHINVVEEVLLIPKAP